MNEVICWVCVCLDIYRSWTGWLFFIYYCSSFLIWPFLFCCHPHPYTEGNCRAVIKGTYINISEWDAIPGNHKKIMKWGLEYFVFLIFAPKVISLWRKGIQNVIPLARISQQQWLRWSVDWAWDQFRQMAKTATCHITTNHSNLFICSVLCMRGITKPFIIFLKNFENLQVIWFAATCLEAFFKIAYGLIPSNFTS